MSRAGDPVVSHGTTPNENGTESIYVSIPPWIAPMLSLRARGKMALANFALSKASPEIYFQPATFSHA